ncbi:MAG: TolC family protein [Melioribacteraceae bacterium]|nr:TolC family protein [Melioribacteraceae bacterium]
MHGVPRSRHELYSKKIIISLSLFLFFITGVSLSSQTLNNYLEVAAENNPGLKSKFYSYQASLEKIPQVGGLPDPELSFGYFIKPMERYVGNQVAEISLMQMFPWFGTLGSAEDEAALIAKAKYEEFNDTKSQLFFDVKKVWYELYLLEKEIKITEENIEILETLEQIANSRLASGEANQSSVKMAGKNPTMVDVLRAEIEINELKNKLALLLDKKVPLKVRFNNLLNRTKDEFINIPDTIIISNSSIQLAELADSVQQNNPVIKKLRNEEKAFIAKEEMNIKNSYPKIGLGLKYSIFESRAGVQSMMNGNNMIMPMASISIPIWRGKYNSAIDESRIRQNEISARRNDTKNMLTENYEIALKDLRDAERRIELYSDQTKLVNQALDLLIVQYSTTGSQFEEVLRLQQQYLDYKLKRLQAKVDQKISVAMIDRLIGR